MDPPTTPVAPKPIIIGVAAAARHKVVTPNAPLVKGSYFNRKSIYFPMASAARRIPDTVHFFDLAMTGALASSNGSMAEIIIRDFYIICLLLLIL